MQSIHTYVTDVTAGYGRFSDLIALFLRIFIYYMFETLYRYTKILSLEADIWDDKIEVVLALPSFDLPDVTLRNGRLIDQYEF